MLYLSGVLKVKLKYFFVLKSQAPLDNTAKFTKGYEDCLQNPLQPLMDNLESQVYEIFEKDPCKYVLYQQAIAQALLDRISEHERYKEV
jgi:protein arginine N-methyltransferase 5